MEYEDLTREELIEMLKQKDRRVTTLECNLRMIKGDQDKIPSGINNFQDSDTSIVLKMVQRYSRQLILPEIGPKGQKLLSSASILIVGCGGLGCPAAIYLAASGIGKLGLLDFDDIEISNLHRQILHTEERVGTSKAHSVAKSVHDLNSNVLCIPQVVAATSQNIMSIISNYNIVLDCTDNVATRYLLNDACVFSHKPLVSGSALKFEGQLTVYAYQDGPCYRCLFPKPPPPETVTNCSDGGVVGAVPGVIGCLQALEAIKIAADFGEICFKKLILFDALSMSFRNIKLRSKQSHCEICSESPTINSLINYEQFCGAGATDKDKELQLLNENKRITVQEYKKILVEHIPHLLVDVRSPVELEICSLPNSLNVPMNKIDSKDTITLVEEYLKENLIQKIICICRRGNDSQIAVQTLESSFPNVRIPIVDIVGGLTAWAKQIDANFPIY